MPGWTVSPPWFAAKEVLSSSTTPMPLVHPTSDAAPRWSGREIAALLALLVAICFMTWPGMTSAPYYDDLNYMAHVAEFKSWADVFKKDVFGVFRPLKTSLYYAFELQGMPSLFAWHAFVLGAYLIATASIHVLLRSLTCSAWWGLAGACMWATSATQASTAVWMSCINISVSVAFGCGVILLYVRSWRDGRRWLLAPCLVLLFLSLASYETALFIAPILVLLDHLHGRRVFSKSALIRYGCIAAVTLSFLYLRSSLGGTHSAQGHNLGFDPEMPTWQLIVSAPWFLWRHFSMWVLPFGRIEFLSAYVWGKSASMVDLSLAWVFLIGLIGVALAAGKRMPLLCFGIAWFLLASFPCSNFVPIWVGPIEDYYVVFPSVGLAIAAVALLQLLVRRVRDFNLRPVVLLSAGGVIALVLVSRIASATYFPLQARLWNDPVEQLSHLVESRPYQYQAMTSLALASLESGDYGTAEKNLRESLEVAPWYPYNYSLLGSVDMHHRRYEEAIRNFDIYYSMTTREGDYCLMCKGDALVALKRPAEAREVWVKILVDPTSKQHYDTTIRLATLYHDEGNTEKAIQTLQKSRKIHPDRAAEIDAAIAEFATIPGEQDESEAQ
ncbi:hypothetical protein OKA04_05730 [Luteolibacter flavescens]|uniref:Tetratricopeptide repeat protein n=1 Tax=Luteolibacter flavescens TaxID=1859460 RepID=A0ABT3FKX6_9BACT|nr:hypothetical protein [Luteolibacter flavescens]MCW1884222.1 hypothetical protein [Luteolibacter flavescens]